MPRGKHVKLTIGADGSCQIDAVNFTDASCQSVTNEIAALLGRIITHQHAKPEARQRVRAPGETEAAR
jgi:hypothetical protein